MKPTHLLSVLLMTPFAMAAPNLQGAITVNDTGFSYSQDFNSLPTANTGTFTWTDNSTLAGWYRRANVNTSTQTPDPDLVDLSAQGSNVGVAAFYNASVANNADRAVGFRINGDPAGLKKGSVGLVLTNNTGSTINSLELGYTGEKWYQAVNATTLLVQYAIVDSFATDISADIDRAQADTWIDITPLNWTVAAGASNVWTNGTQTGNFNVFTPVTLSGLSIADGQQLVIRWRIAEAANQRSGLFIDDVSIGNISVVPEPATVALLAGFSAWGLVLLRRSRKAAR